MKNNLEKWVKIDALLQEKLKDLEALDSQRQKLIKKASKQELTPKLQKEMEESVRMYESLANEVSELKLKAKEIKES